MERLWTEKEVVRLVRKYQGSRPPYYTTYPTGSQWSSAFSPQDFKQALRAQGKGRVKLALYIHIPFCAKRCYYCCCYTHITQNRERISSFLSSLFREIDLVLAAAESSGLVLDVREIHLGGGSPSYLAPAEFDLLIGKLSSFINLGSLDEFTMEIDPRNISSGGQLAHYLASGVSRLSFGIQDFDSRVQEAVNRVQPAELIQGFLPDPRPCSVNFDLIYGLPFQTRETFQKTMETVMRFSPDRVSLYNYDHTPHIYPHQQLIPAQHLPSLEEKTRIHLDAVRAMLANGYVFVGIDHFAKKKDKLALAMEGKTLWRNLNGYTTERTYFFELGIGPSSITSLPGHYAHNERDLAAYHAAVSQGRLPVFRGCRLNADDLVRRDVIFSLICQLSLDFASMEKRHAIVCRDYFAEELASLKAFEDDRMVLRTEDGIQVTPLGRFFLPIICTAFDHYLKKSKTYRRTQEAVSLVQR